MAFNNKDDRNVYQPSKIRRDGTILKMKTQINTNTLFEGRTSLLHSVCELLAGIGAKAHTSNGQTNTLGCHYSSHCKHGLIRQHLDGKEYNTVVTGL